jgi:hypothetical protein
MPVHLLTPERVEEARLLYEAGIVPVEDVVALLEMSRDAFYRFRHAQGWQLRRPPMRQRAFAAKQEAATPGAPERPPAPVAPMTLDEMIPKIEAAINREFALAEHALAHGEPRNAEKTAKTMASLVRSLAELKRVKREAQGHERHNDGPGEAPTRDLDELKAELARRLDRLRRARDAERGA